MEDNDQIDAFIQQVKTLSSFVPFMLMYVRPARREVLVKHKVHSQ